MTLPAPNLDDLRFQSDLVDEARKRIITYCPEWTEYNLSDPGITLIELFAWMTELITYRLNRVPERNYIKFLDMLGFQRQPAQSARADITFWLSALLPLSADDETVVVVPEGSEAQSEQQPEPLVFTTTRQLRIVAPLTRHLRRENDFNVNFINRLGVELFYPFNQKKPQNGDMFYIGFDPKNDICGHILTFNFICEPTEAVGIRREDPPWVWECLTETGWVEIKPSRFEGERDTTGGLNNEEGSLTLYMPQSFKARELHGLDAFWTRCRLEQRNPSQGMYTESPRVMGLEVFTAGAQVSALNARVVEDEYLGESNGDPGQRFNTLNAPILNFSENETVAVEETIDGEKAYVPWKLVKDFSASTRYDRHFTLDTASGTIIFGPSARQSDGSVIQYGKIPEMGRGVRVVRYRYGGGAAGNLPENTINTMAMSLAYISRASNLQRAIGGRDQETMDELIMRAQREMQAQKRAVTARDFERFALNSSRAVRRAFCVPPEKKIDAPSGMVTILITPDVVDALMEGELRALHLSDELRSSIRNYIDQYRLLTTTLNIREPRYFGVSVKAAVIPYEFANPNEVISGVERALKRFLCPLSLTAEHPLNQGENRWEGWEFGRSLFKAEIVSLIQKVPLVKYALDVDVSWRPVVPNDEIPGDESIRQAELLPLDKALLLPPDGLICSLAHSISISSLDEIARKEAGAAS